MRVGEYTPQALRHLLRTEGLVLRHGPFRVRLRARSIPIAPVFHSLYADYPVASQDSLADVDIRLRRPSGIRRWWDPQAILESDGNVEFSPFPLDHAFPLWEWGLNWCVAMRAHQYLMLHSGVVEKHGRAVLFPAWPGSGKSTLSAALAYRGWRLLSDEFGLVRPEDSALIPFPRPIPLKNQSIAVIREFAPDAVFGPTYPKTRKGDVAHVKPPASSIERAQEPAQPALIVFPNYVAGAPLDLAPMAKSRAFLKLSGNSFNYEIQGARGFKAVAQLIKACDCYSLTYSQLDDAIAVLDQRIGEHDAP